MSDISNSLPAAFGNPTMSSREIAELVGSRHDKVRQSIERLAERGVIGLPPLGEYLDRLGRPATEYRIGKRDSYVIVAQLSPEFTARLVDRWQELEAMAPQPIDPRRALSDPAALRTLLLENVEKVIALEAQVVGMKEDVDAHTRLTKADGSVNVTEAAKNLGLRPKALFDWLKHNGWIYKRPGASSWLGHSTKCNTGLLEHKTTTVLRADGSEKIAEQVRITAKGLSRLAKLIPPTARLVA